MTALKLGAAIEDQVGAGILNKYTPPSILQELSWAAGLGDKGTVTHEDVESLFFELSDGRVVDTHLTATKPGSFEVALARRQIVADIFRSAFSCEVVVITLGYIEAWWDVKTQLFINMAPNRALAREADRFYFGRLDYNTCYDYVRRTIELPNSSGPRKKVLLTTSPVPLVRTVAGKIAEDLDDVDYFPSFESVMVTKQPYVWHDDLLHVEGTFINQIMTRVKLSYLEAGEASVANEIGASEIIALTQRKDFVQALEKYREYKGDVFGNNNPEFHAACVAVADAAGLKAEALRHAQCVRDGDSLEPAHVFAAARVMRNNGLAEQAGALEKRCIDTISGNTERALLIINQLKMAERFADAGKLIDQYVDPSNVMGAAAGALANIYHLAQRPEAALPFVLRAVKQDPTNVGLVMQAARLLRKEERWEDMLSVLNPLLAVDKSYPALTFKQIALRRLGQLDEAIACAEEMVALFPRSSEHVRCSTN